MDHLGRTVFCRLLHALLLILKSDTFVLLACDPKLRSYLTVSVLCILYKEIWAGFPALATAYAALSIYYCIDHEIIPAYVDINIMLYCHLL
jgi:hypothetical protein